MGKFESVQLRNMVAAGAVGPSWGRLWFRARWPGEHVVSLWPMGRPAEKESATVTISPDDRCDQTASLRYPDDFPAGAPLRPLQRYQFEVRRVIGDEPLGAGRFETAPRRPGDSPDKFAVGVMSCHQPFNSDGALSERSMRMLRLAPRVLSGYDAKFVLMCGDQIYADAPGDFSLANPHYYGTKIDPSRGALLDANAEEVRRAYQERYRIFWSMRELRHIYANYPCYPILDDHEIIDDWGALPIHATGRYRALSRGAREAYFDYQGSRVAPRSARLPKSFHYTFDWGATGVFVLDLRSERVARRDAPNTLYGGGQLRALERFLRRSRDKRVILIVASVPVIHLPSWLADTGHSLVGHDVDFADHWSYRQNLAARDALLRLIHAHQEAHPKQRVVLVSGDVHIGCAFALHWKGGHKPILYQFTSSAISNRLKASSAYFSGLGPQLVSSLACGNGGPSARVNLIGGSHGDNPFGGLNLGIIEIRNRGDHSTVNFKLIGYPAVDQWETRTMFESGEL